jgi:hypothetical protein
MKNSEMRKDSSKKSDPEILISLFIAEYNVLRNEIDLYHNQQEGIVNFVIIVFTAMFGILGASIVISPDKSAETIESIAFIFLLFPIIYTLLSFFYLDRKLRIIRIADYVHNNLRKKVYDTCGEYVWQWEVYKKSTKIFNRRLALWLDRSRFLVFFIPSIASIFLFLKFVSYPLQLIHCILILLDILALILTICAMWIDETTGISHRLDIDIDKFENPAFEKKGVT